jgi:hypothetical protein
LGFLLIQFNRAAETGKKVHEHSLARLKACPDAAREQIGTLPTAILTVMQLLAARTARAFFLASDSFCG